ncbi:MAG: ADP-ribosylglycohydrolase family protein [Gammaproteobacteria bacterium]
MSPDALAGCLLGTAVGDALGLPYEGMSARRGGRLFPDRRRHHLLPGRGMVSDDTEHACFTAQALISSDGDVARFTRVLARSLRWWFAGLPAGVGFATARSILKLWLGVSPERSGVFWLEGIVEWPRSTRWIEALAGTLADACIGTSHGSVPRYFPALVLRNLVFLVIVLGHGFRRLLPPY